MPVMIVVSMRYFVFLLIFLASTAVIADLPVTAPYQGNNDPYPSKNYFIDTGNSSWGDGYLGSSRVLGSCSSGGGLCYSRTGICAAFAAIVEDYYVAKNGTQSLYTYSPGQMALDPTDAMGSPYSSYTQYDCVVPINWVKSDGQTGTLVVAKYIQSKITCSQATIQEAAIIASRWNNSQGTNPTQNYCHRGCRISFSSPFSFVNYSFSIFPEGYRYQRPADPADPTSTAIDESVVSSCGYDEFQRVKYCNGPVKITGPFAYTGDTCTSGLVPTLDLDNPPTIDVAGVGGSSDTGGGSSGSSGSGGDTSGGSGATGSISSADLQALGSNIGSSVDGAAGQITSAIGGLSGDLDGQAQQITQSVDSASTSIIGAVNGLGSNIDQQTQQITGAISDSGDAIAGAIGSLGADINNQTQSITGAVNGVNSGVADVGVRVGQAVGKLGDVEAAVNGIKSELGSQTGEVVGALEGLSGDIGAAADEVGQHLDDALGYDGGQGLSIEVVHQHFFEALGNTGLLSAFRSLSSVFDLHNAACSPLEVDLPTMPTVGIHTPTHLESNLVCEVTSTLRPVFSALFIGFWTILGIKVLMDS